jgi:excisionase family DNA binding protein
MFQLLSQGRVRSVRVGKLRRIRLEDLEQYVSTLG